MSKPQRLQLFNPAPETAPSTATFHRFADLPREIRLQIWEIPLRRERILKVMLSDRRQDDERIFMASGEGRQSRLLRVCRDSRQAVLSFYRVHLPCHSIRDGPIPAELGEHFYLNPEWDVLQPSIEARDVNLFLRFLKDMKDRDPVGVGLRRVMLDDNVMYKLVNVVMQGSSDPSTAEAARDVIRGLTEVSFMAVEPTGRLWFKDLTGLRMHQNVLEHHTTLPIWSDVPTFQRIPRDPRECEEDLKRVFTGSSDPREMVKKWQWCLDNWGVTLGDDVVHKMVIAATPLPETRLLRDRASAKKWLEDEEEIWQKNLNLLREERGEEGCAYGPAKEKHVNKSAIGFWIFPLEVVGPFPKKEDEPKRPKGMRVLDMTDHWPELGLFDLST